MCKSNSNSKGLGFSVSVKSVKYLFKYVHKGCDMINAALVDSIQNDEIAQYMESRYIAQCEAVYRIFHNSLITNTIYYTLHSRDHKRGRRPRVPYCY
jgi:hypothetical protein